MQLGTTVKPWALVVVDSVATVAIFRLLAALAAWRLLGRLQR